MKTILFLIVAFFVISTPVHSSDLSDRVASVEKILSDGRIDCTPFCGNPTCCIVLDLKVPTCIISNVSLGKLESFISEHGAKNIATKCNEDPEEISESLGGAKVQKLTSLTETKAIGKGLFDCRFCCWSPKLPSDNVSFKFCGLCRDFW